MPRTKYSSNSSRGDGNTKVPPIVEDEKKQISPCKHWVFTLNNYTNDDIRNISSNSSIDQYIFQEETGEEGTPHLQGYIKFKTKVRPMGKFKNKKIHWERCKYIQQAIDYCHKEETRTGEIYTNMIYDKPLKLLSKDMLYGWQREILDICNQEPDDRSIHWYWEERGAKGKSALCKLLCANFGALCVSGKSADCKYAIVKYKELHRHYPKVILFDIPRSNIDYINYEAIEKIKDGLFFVGKYESQQVIMNCPHIFIFANEYPTEDKLSADRWKINYIE